TRLFVDCRSSRVIPGRDVTAQNLCRPFRAARQPGLPFALAMRNHTCDHQAPGHRCNYPVLARRDSCSLMRRSSLLIAFLLAIPVQAEPIEFQLTFDAKAKATPFTGRVHVLLSKGKRTEPPEGPSWFRPEPAFALDVRDWKPGEKLVIGKDALAYPTPLDK